MRPILFSALFCPIRSLTSTRLPPSLNRRTVQLAFSTTARQEEEIPKAHEAEHPTQTFCIGATNRPDLLDPAMFRPGRFDRLVYLGIHQSDYAQILMAQLRSVKVEGDRELIANAVADVLPPTMTGADLSGIVSAAILGAKNRLDSASGTAIRRV